MSTKLFFAVASLLSTAFSQVVDKPFIYRSGEIESYGPRLRSVWDQSLKIKNFSSWDDLPAKRDQIPWACVGWYDSWLTSLKPVDFTVYEVFYNDSDQPWLFCMHKDVSTAIITPYAWFAVSGKP